MRGINAQGEATMHELHGKCPTGGRMSNYREHVLGHYEKEAAARGLDERCTMADLTTRDIEVEAICALVAQRAAGRSLRLLEIGCGNGYLQDVLRNRFATIQLTGLDFSPPMVELAQARKVGGATIVRGDVMDLPFPGGAFDIVVGERCIINLMQREHQERAFAEVARVLATDGRYLCVEAFLAPLEALNEARAQLGLDAHPQAHHNLWFEDDWFFKAVGRHFDVETMEGADARGRALVPNFLSSYYFMSRVVYPSVTKAPVQYNTHFVRFFSEAPARGDYAPIKLYLLRKRG